MLEAHLNWVVSRDRYDLHLINRDVSGRVTHAGAIEDGVIVMKPIDEGALIPPALQIEGKIANVISDAFKLKGIADGDRALLEAHLSDAIGIRDRLIDVVTSGHQRLGQIAETLSQPPQVP